MPIATSKRFAEKTLRRKDLHTKETLTFLQRERLQFRKPTKQVSLSHETCSVGQRDCKHFIPFPTTIYSFPLHSCKLAYKYLIHKKLEWQEAKIFLSFLTWTQLKSGRTYLQECKHLQDFLQVFLPMYQLLRNEIAGVQ